MALTLEEEIAKKIEEVLRLSYLPLNSTDIYELLLEKWNKEINRNTFNSVLTNLSNQNFISKKRILGRRDNFYSTLKRDDVVDYIEIYITGKYVSFSSDFPEKEADNEIIKKELLQAVGIINYFDIRKFCGIHQYDPKNLENLTVQRARQIAWVQKLETYLDNLDTTMLTAAIIYFDKEDIELEELSTLGDFKLYKIKIPYGGPTFDDYKKGWILDGQQRMWATDFIAIKKEEQSHILITPISIVIGEFDEDEEVEKRQIIRKIFLVANQTKGITGALLKSLTSFMDPKRILSINEDTSIYATYEKIARQLNLDNDSPFKDLIDLSNLAKIRKDTELISLGNMTECIKIIIEENSIIFKKGFLPDTSWAYKNNLARIKDYFNCIKVVWDTSWRKKYDLNRIKAPVVLFAFAHLFHEFIGITNKDKSRLEFIKDLFIRNLLKIKNETSFDISDPFVRNISNTMKSAKLLKNQYISWITSSTVTINPVEVENIFTRIKDLYSPESLSSF